MQESKEQAAAAAYAPLPPQEYHRQLEINVANENKSNSINNSNLELVEGRGNAQIGEINYDSDNRENTLSESTYSEMNQEGKMQTHTTAGHNLTDADMY